MLPGLQVLEGSFHRVTGYVVGLVGKGYLQRGNRGGIVQL